MVKNYDESIKVNDKPNQSYFPDHLYKILIIGFSRSVKTNTLKSLIKHQRSDVDKAYLYIKDLFESKYQQQRESRD